MLKHFTKAEKLFFLASIIVAIITFIICVQVSPVYIVFLFLFMNLELVAVIIYYLESIMK